MSGAVSGVKVWAELLLDHLIEQSESNSIWTLQASIFPENKASIALHANRGFREIGFRERVAKLNGVWRDTVLLERRSRTVGLSRTDIPVCRRFGRVCVAKTSLLGFSDRQECLSYFEDKYRIEKANFLRLNSAPGRNQQPPKIVSTTPEKRIINGRQRTQQGIQHRAAF